MCLCVSSMASDKMPLVDIGYISLKRPGQYSASIEDGGTASNKSRVRYSAHKEESVKSRPSHPRRLPATCRRASLFEAKADNEFLSEIFPFTCN